LNELIKIENIAYEVVEHKLFTGGGRKNILNKISFEIKKGSLFGITGESGSGKTTLIKLLANIYKPVTGNILYNFPLIKNGRSNVQVLFQNSEDLINPARKIENQLKDIADDPAKITEVFDVLSLNKNLLQQRGLELSGGERQRIALAKLLLVQPQVLICDEPFSAQDPASKLNFVELFKKINKQLGITIVCVSHEIDILKLFVTDLLILYGGQIAETGKAQPVFAKPVHPYTNFLLQAIEYNLSEKDLINRNGLENIEEGCPFYLRCNVKLEKCKNEVDKIEESNRTVYCNNPLK